VLFNFFLFILLLEMRVVMLVTKVDFKDSVSMLTLSSLLARIEPVFAINR